MSNSSDLAAAGSQNELPDDSPFSHVTQNNSSSGGGASDGTSGNKFMGLKERRKSSSVKVFLGDNLSLATNQAILKVLAKNGNDQSIVFSDTVVKINKRNKMQERTLMITDQAIYNIDPSNNKVKRRIALKELGSISLSKLPDNFFCLHVPSEYDYLMVSNKKTEIVTRLVEAFEKCTHGEKLPVTFSNSFDYKIDKDVYREILFTSVDGGISTQIFTKKKKDRQ